jgi:Carboxypeptidase regulatory-like domain
LVSKRVAAAVLCLVLAQTIPCSAQVVQTSSIVGTVFDGSGAVVPQVRITVEGSNLIGGPLAVATDSAGQYLIQALPPGTYQLTAIRGGFSPGVRSDIVLRLATTATVDLVLGSLRISEEVAVRQTVPAVDVTSASVSTHIDRTFLELLPTRRTVAGVINLAPGVANDVGFGGTNQSNAIYIDGVDMTEPSLQSPWLHVNYNWLEQVEVATLGAPVEYGESTGVVANAVLQSGGNRLDGFADYWTTRPSWTGRNTDDPNFTPRQILSWWDTGVQLGGPIAKDRAWFFGGWQSLRHETRPAGYAGPWSTVETEHRALVKITAAPRSSVRLDGFLQPAVFDYERGGVGPFVRPEAADNIRQPQIAWNARLTWSAGPSTLIEARSGGFQSTSSFSPEYRDGPPGRRDQLTGILYDNAQYFSDSEQRQITTAVTLSHSVRGRWGHHDARVGLEYEASHHGNVEGFPGGANVFDIGGVPSFANVWAGDVITVNGRRTALYAQDTWQLGRVSVSPGLRVDVNRASVPLVADAFATTPVSPRIGVAWDVTGTHRLVARAHVGRYTDPLLLNRIGNLDFSQLTPLIFGIYDAAGQLVEIERDFGEGFAIDSDMRHSYVDQLVAGIDWQAPRGVSVQAHYIHRSFEQFMTTLRPSWIWTPVSRQDPGPDGILRTADDGSFFTAYNLDTSVPSDFLLYTNPADAWRRYDGVQMVAHSRVHDRLQTQASYTWSQTKGTVGNENHANAGLRDLGLASVFSNPNRQINLFGHVVFDPAHELKILQTAILPWWGGFNLSGVYQFRSGNTWARRAVIRLDYGAEPILMEPRGSRRLEATSTLGVRVEKVISPGRTSSRLGIYAEAFNLFNQGVAGSVNNNSGPFFGQPSSWLDPRVLRMGVRWMF